MKIKAKLTKTQANILFDMINSTVDIQKSVGISDTCNLWQVFGRRLGQTLGKAGVFDPEPASILKEADWVDLCHMLDLSHIKKTKLSGLTVSDEDSTALYEAIAEPVAKVLVDRGCADSLVIKIDTVRRRYSHG